MSVAEDIEKARKESAAQAAEAERLAKLSAEFPDLKKSVGRWNKIAFYSKSVNEKVDDVDIRHNCGCCSDSPVEAWPNLKTPLGPVYSDPPKFWVGRRDYYADGGERADVDWDVEMRKAGIPETIIARVGAYLGVEPSEATSEDPKR